ncbi:sensor histidine kinase [Pyxidicoccus fallax]|uniref:Sensor histidine kinase n=1 Tax=Pyxidicoccus fallax TaxID=394095 RepID=A0A848LNM5_9BACT|nr:sensor histidine kinase [Pyxidicoccus fallax]NMO19154.1 sensor histidine kinase [Pyxidicoccus fallax]NPC81285.1 sensor histidine kinase [Pyxidicoccus fallax]
MSAAASTTGGTRLDGVQQEQNPTVRLTALESVEAPEVFRVDVTEAVADAVELLGVTRRLHGVEVTVELPQDPVPTRVSSRRLRQVLLLLLAHASDTANGQGVKLTVDEPDDFGDVGPRFQVVTQGASLSEREAKAVFLSPMLVGPVHRRLARARELVDSMGGTLEVTRGAASGITVTVELPAPGLSSW